ncbi:MAG: LysE family transporter [Proteobacteria bacterium]|nr:LysE family transporter [Pseudomonadota bacterium]
MISLFIKGFLIGLSIAAPVGPIGVLCINRTLSAGLVVGLLSGLGAASADAIYGCIAGFGLVAVSKFLLSQQTIIQLVGGAFLLYLGIKTFFASPQARAISDRATTLWQDFSSTLFLTLTNPATIISFIAIYTSLGIVERNANYMEALVIVLGVFLGSLAWWCILSSSISHIRHKLSEVVLMWNNRFSGLILIGFGFFSLISGLILRK